MHLWMQMVATKCTSNKQKHHTGKGITSYGFLKPPQRRGSDKTARPTPDCDNTADQLHTNLHQASGIKHTIYFEEHAGATLERSPSKSAECRADQTQLSARQASDRKTPFQHSQHFGKFTTCVKAVLTTRDAPIAVSGVGVEHSAHTNKVHASCC